MEKSRCNFCWQEIRNVFYVSPWGKKQTNFVTDWEDVLQIVEFQDFFQLSYDEISDYFRDQSTKSTIFSAAFDEISDLFRRLLTKFAISFSDGLMTFAIFSATFSRNSRYFPWMTDKIPIFFLKSFNEIHELI